MAVIALHSAASGLSALSTQLDVIANNLANINTQGFKGSRVNFQDLLYIERKQAGVENVNGDIRPLGLHVGLGTEVSGTHKMFTQGPAEQTGRELDVMIEGIGFLQVSVEDDLGIDGLAYSRAGNLALNADGELVLATDQGRRIEPGITIDGEFTNIEFSEDGTVSVMRPGGEIEEVGQLELASFINPAGLKEVGENLYVETAASGEPTVGTPTENGLGAVQQGFLEGSNVEPVRELVDLIKTQRAFELNGQALRAADEALQQINTLRRR